MTTLTCDEVDAQLELFAGGECAEAEEAVIAAHLAGCRRCANAAAEARMLVGLLTLRHQEDAARLRLRKALDADRAAPVILPLRRPSMSLKLTRRIAAVAAMLLCVVGAWSMLDVLTPSGEPRPEAQVAKASRDVVKASQEVVKAARNLDHGLAEKRLEHMKVAIAPAPAADTFGFRLVEPGASPRDYLRTHACVAGRWHFLSKTGELWRGALSEATGNVPPTYPAAGERARVVGPLHVETSSSVPDLRTWQGQVILLQPDASIRFGTAKSLAGTYRLIGYETSPGDGARLLFKKHPGLEYKP
jgi:hypothetical protein